MFSKTVIKIFFSSGIIYFLAGLYCVGYSQADKKFIRQGNSQYRDKMFPESEVWYRKALDKNKLSTEAGFNLGDALYKQKKYEEASKQFLESAEVLTDNNKKSASLYNLGNSLLNNNKLQESIEAYKNALKLYPYSKPAKYNLAYAQDLLKQQQEQKQKDKDKEDKKDNKQEDKNNDKNKDQNKNQDQNNKQNQDQKEQQQQQKQGISREDAQRLLEAIANDEKNVQEKVKLAKAAKEKVRTLINW
jgi:Ca-activated chloride channel homolog